MSPSTTTVGATSPAAVAFGLAGVLALAALLVSSAPPTLTATALAASPPDWACPCRPAFPQSIVIGLLPGPDNRILREEETTPNHLVASTFEYPGTSR